MHEQTQKRLRVLLADDHTLLLQAFRNLLRAHVDVVGAVEDGDALVRSACELRPDVVVADVSMPARNGLEAADAILQQLPETRIVFLTMNADEAIAVQAFRLGAAGYLLKSDTASELVECIQRVAEGGVYLSRRIADGDVTKLLGADKNTAAQSLTPREREVVGLLAAGHSMPKVAALLGIAPRTVAFHKYRAMAALGARNGGELIAVAVKLNLV